MTVINGHHHGSHRHVRLQELLLCKLLEENQQLCRTKPAKISGMTGTVHLRSHVVCEIWCHQEPVVGFAHVAD